MWNMHQSESIKLQVKQQALKNKTNSQDVANVAVNDDNNESTVFMMTMIQQKVIIDYNKSLQRN